jgi:hypothetical protein
MDMAFQRTVTQLDIDLLKQERSLIQARKALSIEQRTAIALAKGERLLAEARRAAKKEG